MFYHFSIHCFFEEHKVMYFEEFSLCISVCNASFLFILYSNMHVHCMKI